MLNTNVPIGFLDQLSRTKTRQEVFDTYARWTGEIIQCDRSTVALAEAGDTHLRLMAIEGNQAIATGTQMPISGSFIGNVYKTREAAKLNHIQEHLEFLECPKLVGGGLHALINAPLVVGDICYGCLAVADCNPNAFTKHDVKTLSALARCLASYLLLHDQLDQLSDLVLKDPLTRLHNRRYHEDCMAAFWDGWISRGNRFSLVMLDIDHFKAVNDTHGHVTGDYVLCEVAELLQSAARPQDTVARMGGEEFSLIIADLSHEEALAIAERLRKRVEGHRFRQGGKEITVTISLGVATTTDEHVSHDALTLEADTALYSAKGRGRNRVQPAIAA